jgi:hypothetical protein
MANRFSVLGGIDSEPQNIQVVQERPRVQNKRPARQIHFDRLNGREWTETEYSKQNSNKFRIASYNVLAPSYAKEKYILPEFLNFVNWLMSYFPFLPTDSSLLVNAKICVGHVDAQR